MKKARIALFTLLSLPVLLLGAQQVLANQRIVLNMFPQGPMAQAVTNAWKIEYADYYKQFGNVPDFGMATYDLNGDGRPEVFARHIDDMSGYCYTPELNNNLCWLLVYANTERGLIKIGQIPVADEIVVGTRSNKGVRDLITIFPDGTRKLYVWNGQAFEEQ